MLRNNVTGEITDGDDIERNDINVAPASGVGYMFIDMNCAKVMIVTKK